MSGADCSLGQLWEYIFYELHPIVQINSGRKKFQLNTTLFAVYTYIEK